MTPHGPHEATADDEVESRDGVWDTIGVTLKASHSRRFVPGTTGWTEDDLDDPRLNRQWQSGRYEIVEGVLTRMPAAYLQGSLPLRRLIRQVERHLEDALLPGEFAFEVDMVINRVRLPIVDAVFLTPDQLRMQEAIDAGRPNKKGLRFGRLRVPPQLVIESISPGHELHDRQTKFDWYRGFGIPNYWLFDAYRRTLECLELEQGNYIVNVAGKDSDEIAPAMLPGLKLQLGKVWM